MTTLNIITSILAGVFIILITRAVIKVKKDNRKLIRDAKTIEENEKAIEAAKRQGKKPFYFDRHRYMVLAISYKEATIEYQRMKKLVNIEKK